MFCTPAKIALPENLDSIEIEGYTIRKMTTEDKSHFLGIKDAVYDDLGRVISSSLVQSPITSQLSFLFSEIDLMLYKSCNSIIECREKEQLSNFLLALRLFKQGNLIAPITVSDDTNNIQINYPFATHEVSKYDIGENGFDNIKDIYKSINSIKSSTDKKFKAIQMSLERFAEAIQTKTTIPNSFVNLVSILEALFMDSKSEMTYKFTLYISYLLNKHCGLNYSFKYVDKIYGIRSEYAHQGYSEKATNNVFIDLIDISRKLIKFYIKNDCSVSVKTMILNDLLISNE